MQVVGGNTDKLNVIPKFAIFILQTEMLQQITFNTRTVARWS